MSNSLFHDGIICDRWWLYDWLKHQYMRTGYIPTANEARAAFPELPLEEMGEGYTEFMAVVGRYEGA